jgi:hypothetical protein
VVATVVALVGRAVSPYDGVITALFGFVWAVAWFDPHRWGLGPISRAEYQFDQALRPINRQIWAVPGRADAERLVSELSSLDPPGPAWRRIHGLLVDHLRDQLGHSNPSFIPDRWRVVRARELWGRLLSRNILWSRRRQTPEEFDAQMCDLATQFADAVNLATQDRSSGLGGTRDEAARTAPRRILSEMAALDPPDAAWRQVLTAEIEILEEDLATVDAGRRPSRSADDPTVRELRRLWQIARAAG